jgi:tetratricopeptide (TPR) repeat protein
MMRTHSGSNLPVLFASVICFALISVAVPGWGQRGGRGGGRGGDNSPAEAELQKGISLTQSGKFQEAIAHFLTARGQVANDYALNFNLALCYVATGQSRAAIAVLNELRRDGHENADVENLLAQALLGNHEPDEAFAAVERASRITPKDEKLYIFVAEACQDGGYADVGLKVTELGLGHLPRSARLVFEHGMLLVQLDRMDEAKQDFQKVAELAPGSDVGYIAAVQKNLFEGNVAEALRVAREGVRKGIQHSTLLALYGEAAMEAGIGPDDLEFAGARAALERAVAERPTNASAQISLGKLYLLEGRFDEAIAHLEAARQLDPKNAAAYSNLAAAYRKRGDAQHADEMLAILAKLNEEQAERLRNAPGERKAGYAAQPKKSSEKRQLAPQRSEGAAIEA